MAKVATAKRKVRKNVAKAVIHIKASFNNTLITVTDIEGDTICTSSAGCVGFKGARKSTPFAASQAASRAAGAAMRNGVREVEIKVKGPGPGRESAIAALQQAGLRIASIEDVTPLPHNGCRPPKRRRI
ncbi:MAG: 30S ribosomal protein S11 [Sedimentisphaerales bacterium]|nr:30S ribosomal protein S11 [Sedimentisphaerales bacterium]